MKLENDRKIKSIVVTPNHIMGIISSLSSTYQLHIFLLLLEKLKGFSQKEFNNYLAGQKALFEQEVLTMKINLSDVSKPSEYRDVKTTFLKMSKILCEIRYKEDSIEKIWSGSLFSVSIPVKANYSSIIKVNMDVVVARLFINFNRNSDKLPSFYSKIDTNIRLHTKFKNSVKLYLYLSLWKNRPFFKVRLSELCNSLGLTKTYNNPSNFKKHILEPSYPILKEFNDVWFDFEKTIISKNRKDEDVVDFKVLNRETAEFEQNKNNQIIDLLTNHFNFNLNDLKEIDEILYSVSKDRIVGKLSELLHTLSNVKNKAEYTKTALKNAFKL
ncbi:replication initiation protein [Sphingobacterium suaedae]|uniref:Replication initiation protein n=1 Tax=Sphingobacterium suaedae TaxID=1686402 RepID=A0ABW5KI01_9SPHI